ncbi:hypothetical protein DSL92_03930 [Billgrantia gudaonensis]|uniref:Uncharacterized protein n=1 Tax=Billgrantia gudaonensis TaxID=376427 RepID=A0A3S0Q1C5_9GAMM|nr:hypothetical protein DSL92_03930 [Halomonas gudaonensis]
MQRRLGWAAVNGRRARRWRWCSPGTDRRVDATPRWALGLASWAWTVPAKAVLQRNGQAYGQGGTGHGSHGVTS